MPPTFRSPMPWSVWVTSSHRSHAVYRVLSATKLPRVLRSFNSGAPVFCFHNVVAREDAGAGDRSLHMDGAHFEALLGWASRAYDVVPLDELLERLDAGRSVRGLLVLTFDDAYEGFFRHAQPVLERLGLPATVFVVPGASTRPAPFWWDRVAEAGLLSDELRARHLEHNRGVRRDVLDDAGVDGDPAASDLPASLLPARWDRIRSALAGQDLVTVGSHTATHPNLTRMTDEELEHELATSREQIGERLDVAVDTVSYPYGLHDARVREAARRAGYRAGLTLDRGGARPGGDPLGIPRMNVPATIGVEALECWAAGLRP